LGQTTKAISLLDAMIKEKIAVGPEHVGAIIKGLSAKGEFTSAVKMFEKCSTLYKCTPNTFMCNTLLKGLVNQAETIPLAESVIQQMDNMGLVGDAYTVHIVVLGYIRRGMIDKARKFTSRIEQWQVGMNQYLADVLMLLSDIETGKAGPAPKPSSGVPPVVYNSLRNMKSKLRAEAQQKQDKQQQVKE